MFLSCKCLSPFLQKLRCPCSFSSRNFRERDAPLPSHPVQCYPDSPSPCILVPWCPPRLPAPCSHQVLNVHLHYCWSSCGGKRIKEKEEMSLLKWKEKIQYNSLKCHYIDLPRSILGIFRKQPVL